MTDFKSFVDELNFSTERAGVDRALARAEAALTRATQAHAKEKAAIEKWGDLLDEAAGHFEAIFGAEERGTLQ